MQPVSPTPPVKAETAPQKRRTKLKDWDPRAIDTRNLTKARSEWELEDYDNAVICAWKPIENVLNRMVKYPLGASTPDALTLISDALVQRTIDIEWKDKLHLWRRVRNQAVHNNPARAQFTPKQFQDYGFQLIDGAPEFFVHLTERHAPKQMVMETQDEFLQKLQALVTNIQQGTPSPVGGKPLKAIRFNPTHDQFDVLAMQLLMVLRDVRFYVPAEYRWSSSPVIGRFSVDTVGHLPFGFRTHAGNQLRLSSSEQLNQLIVRFGRMLQEECDDSDRASFLHARLSEGLALENGNFHSGLKLNPKVAV